LSNLEGVISTALELGAAGVDRQKAAEKLVQWSAEKLVELSAGRRELLESARDHFIGRLHADSANFEASKALQIIYAALPQVNRRREEESRTASPEPITRKQRAQLLESILDRTTIAITAGYGFPDRVRVILCRLLAYAIAYAMILALMLVAVGAPPFLYASAKVTDKWYADAWLDIGVSLLLIAIFQLLLQRIVLSGKPQSQHFVVAVGSLPVGVIMMLVSRHSVETTSWLSGFLSELGTGLVVLTVVDTLVVGAATYLSVTAE
jgi:hypothetical protein